MRMRRRLKTITPAALAFLLLAACGVGGNVGPLQATPSDTVSPSPVPTPIPTPTVGARPLRLRFAVIGDYGSGFVSQQEVADRMCEWRGDHGFRLVVTTGDNIYPDGSRRYFQDNFFEPYDCLLSNGVRFRASLGNHDHQTRRGLDVIEEPAFGMPKRNYVIRNRGVRLVFADSTELNREWLSEALRARPDDRWTIVIFHHPVYTVGTYKAFAQTFRPELPRLFRERGVDLVLTGHDHLYFASKPLRRIRYVVSGGGGATLYRCGEAWYEDECQARNHFLYVVAGAKRITVRAVPTSGAPFHRFATTGR